MMSNIDEKLLAGKIREEKMKTVAENDINYDVVRYNSRGEGMKSEKNTPLFIKNASLAAKKQRRRIFLKQKRDSVGARTMSGSALRWAWMVLIPSWGLSLIYINAHAFLSVIFPNIVCKLGEEWIPPQMRSRTANGLSYLEWAGLAVLDFIVFCIIMFVVALLGAIIRFLDSSVVGKTILKLLS